MCAGTVFFTIYAYLPDNGKKLETALPGAFQEQGDDAQLDLDILECPDLNVSPDMGDLCVSASDTCLLSVPFCSLAHSQTCWAFSDSGKVRVLILWVLNYNRP
jgi:hypothetical protein